MRPVFLSIFVLFFALVGSHAAVALPMRPYSGIGVLRINAADLVDSVPLYDEPGLQRNGTIKPAAVRELTTWLFGPGEYIYLLVTARKGDWLRVECDDAGRGAWLQKTRRLSYTPWELFLKGKVITFLRNAPQKQLQLYVQPSLSSSGVPLTSSGTMKVIQIQGDWSFVLQDKINAGWIRWRDHDGRLLIGLAQSPAPQSR